MENRIFDNRDSLVRLDGDQELLFRGQCHGARWRIRSRFSGTVTSLETGSTRLDGK
jgi:hypothetical protein